MSGRILFLLTVLAFLNLGVNADYRNASLTEIQTLFDALLEIEGMELDDYEERIRMFAANYQTGQSDEGISIQLMYNEEELEQQLGAKPVRGIEPQLRRNKRGIDPLRMSSTPEYFDGRKYRGKTIINDVVHQGICGNCYLHTFIAALELAYFKGSGELIKFSEQEMTDCYNNGCEGGDFKMVSVTMSYIDKVSTRAGYGEFLSKQVTCRANTTPDALRKIKVVDFIDVTADTVEAAILKYGSVMTCMKWGSKPSDPCYMSSYRAGTTIDYPEIRKGCDHAVLIVGYTPDYYIVRNSHGKTWGEEGYFRIKRNMNSCGIEEDMAAVVIEGRNYKKAIARNGCPLDKPHLCEAIYTCTGQTECTTAMDDLVNEEEEEEEGPAPLINSGASSMQRPGIPSSSSSRSSSSSSRPGIPGRGSMQSSGGSKSGSMSAEDAARMQQQMVNSRGKSGIPSSSSSSGSRPGIPSSSSSRSSSSSSGSRPGIPSSSSSRSSSSASGSRPGIPSSSSSRSSSSASGSRPGIPGRGSMSSMAKSSSGGSKSGSMSAADAARMQQQLAMSRGRSGIQRRHRKRHNIKRTRSRSKRAACADRLGAAKCAALIARGADVCNGFYAPMCLGTCDKCEDAVVKKKEPVEKIGECIKPYIPYGKVLNENDIMRANEVLKVACEPGYTLVGTTNKCLIQDIFTNDDKDARLLPECIKLGEDVLSGDGSTYTGTKNSYNYHGRWFECDSWNYDVFRGVLMGERKAMEYLLGNHNYCRNPGGIEPVPFCIGSARGLGEIVYCFGHPGCDTCKGAVDKYEAKYCESQKRFCNYADRTTKTRVSFVLDVCQATCCAENQCSMT